MVEPDFEYLVEGDRTFSYGPFRDHPTAAFCLGAVTDQGRVDLLVDEEAMYDLWTEVKDRPWPRDEREKAALRTEIVEITGGMDEAQLREVLGILKAIEHGRGWSG